MGETTNGAARVTSSIAGKALVTGASGFIGRRLVARLLDAGVDVVALRRKDSPTPKKGRSAVVDYADRAALRELVALEKPDYVFHVAGATKGVTYADFQLANVMPTENLVMALRDEHRGVKRFVLVSSLASYGPSRPGIPHREDAPRKPIEHYGKSKLEAEQIVEAESAIAWTILRPSGVYGPGDADYLELFKSVERGMNVYFGNKDKLFSAVYVDDLLDAIELTTVSDQARNKGYFVSTGAPLTWLEFQQEIAVASGKRVRTVNLPASFVDFAAFGGELLTKLDKKPRLFNKQKALMGAQEAWTCSSEALERDVGWKPKIGVPEGVRLTIDWYRKERWI